LAEENKGEEKKKRRKGDKKGIKILATGNIWRGIKTEKVFALADNCDGRERCRDNALHKISKGI
jgi:hypothetical protein